MITIQNKAECCGCTACFNICPKNAISMQPDEEGFLYPVVDQEKCPIWFMIEIMFKKQIKSLIRF